MFAGMASSPRSWPRRLLRGARQLRKGDARATRELARLRPFLRFVVVFSMSIIVPAVLLAYLALASISAEELQVDADLERRAESLVMQVSTDVHDLLGGFEDRTVQRLREGQSPLDNLAELSPHLRVAFRFDPEGHLVSPFELPARHPQVEPTAFYRSEWTRGSRLERAGEFLSAAEAYRTAADEATEPSHAAQATFAWGRALRKAGLHAEADQAFSGIYAEYASARDRWGFRVGDLASLERARILLEADPEAGRAALRALVESLLADRWTINRPGEPAVARRALRLLEGAEDADPDWVARARTRVHDRTTQLYWASALAEELELLTSDLPRMAVGELRYVAHPGSPSLWALLWTGEALFAFSLDYDALRREIRSTLARADRLDEQISGHVLRPGDPTPPFLLRSQQLQPLAEVAAVSATDPDAVLELKRQMRRTRGAIITLAVTMSLLGVLLSVRLVRNELETARVKADFAANVSHELRSPITQIRLKGEALQLDLTYDEEDRRQHYATIVHEADRLSRLVDNVLDFAAIERGAKRYSLRADDLTEVIEKTVDAVRADLEARGITLEVDVPPDLPVVWIDRDAIGQVLTNLLSNAAKYGGEAGWVGLQARVGLDSVDVSVSDRGVGIDPEDQRRIFDHFYRSSDPLIRRRKGTGIGLTIVRYIVEAHGGTITVESTPGQGTTFTFTLPLEPPGDVGV